MVKTILFTGISGINKEACLKRLRKYALQNYPKNPRFRDIIGEKFEEEAGRVIPIVELMSVGSTNLTKNFGTLLRRCEKSVHNIPARFDHVISENDPEFIFAHTHASFFLKGQYTSWLLGGNTNLQNIFKTAHIEKVVHLTDNIYETRQAISERPDGYHLSLHEISGWRDVETLITDLITKQLFPKELIYNKSFWLSVHHPLKMICDLLLDENPKRRVYTAYPISYIRELENSKRPEDKKNAKNLQAQNKHFREYMNDKFTVFDPSTIDERPLQNKYKEVMDKGGDMNRNITISTSDLWPQITTETLKVRQKTSWDVPLSEIAEIVLYKDNKEKAVKEHKGNNKTNETAKSKPYFKKKSLVDRMINTRDFRLIDQSDALIAYRPTIKGKWSGGVEAEKDFTIEREGKEVYFIKDESDGEIDLLFEQEKPTFGEEDENIYHREWKNLSSKSVRIKAFDSAVSDIEKKLKKRDKLNLPSY